MSWSRRFDEQIKMPDGKTLRALQDAAEYVLALPKKVQAEPAWQHAAECLKRAAERERTWMWLVRPAMMMRALHGSSPSPIGDPEGKKHPSLTRESWRETNKSRATPKDDAAMAVLLPGGPTPNSYAARRTSFNATLSFAFRFLTR